MCLQSRTSLSFVDRQSNLLRTRLECFLSGSQSCSADGDSDRACVHVHPEQECMSEEDGRRLKVQRRKGSSQCYRHIYGHCHCTETEQRGLWMPCSPLQAVSQTSTKFCDITCADCTCTLWPPGPGDLVSVVLLMYLSETPVPFSFVTAILLVNDFNWCSTPKCQLVL
jgi:hypothetical protein